MSLFEALVETPLAEALGWALLHSLWQGALIAAALAAALTLTHSPRARYSAAGVAMLMTFGALVLTLIQVLPEASHGSQLLGSPALPARSVPPDMGTLGSSQEGLGAFVPWLAPFWIAGAWTFYLWHAIGWISVCRLRRRGVCCAAECWQEQVTRLGARLRLSRPVLLLESSLVDAPIVLGHFRPLILMPIGLLAKLPVAQVEAILLHELAHIRRHDYLVNLLQRSLEGLLFYHPAIWWISRVIRAERENCCDDVAVAMSGNPHEYAVALAALEQNRSSACEPAVAATGGNLVKRIRRLLYPKGPNGAWTPLLATVVLMASAATALIAWPAPPQQSPAAGQGAESAETAPYLRWLNEDVVYIITDEEGAAFLRLTADEERSQFIEQFWLRRDPTPGTAENEFRKEHYRRITYANRRFQRASGGTPGWRTDRGRIYIVYGPPDEIEAHPSGRPQRPYPFEMWRYRHVEGIGDNLSLTFIDRTRSGDYQIAPGSPQ